MEWLLVLLFGILTIVFLSGKGGSLIAGYNTASEEDKKKTDKRKLTFVMGCGMGVITLILAADAWFGDSAPVWFNKWIPYAGIIIVFVMVILANTVCRVKKDPVTETEEEKNSVEKKKYASTKTRNRSVGFVAALLLVIGVLLVTGHIQVTVEQDRVLIAGSYWPDRQVELADIQSLSYREEFKTGSRTGGLGTFKLSEGTFRNEEFGSYTLYAYNSCGEYIVLETSDRVVVVNGKTPEETRKLYEKIEQALNGK